MLYKEDKAMQQQKNTLNMYFFILLIITKRESCKCEKNEWCDDTAETEKILTSFCHFLECKKVKCISMCIRKTEIERIET